MDRLSRLLSLTGLATGFLIVISLAPASAIVFAGAPAAAVDAPVSPPPAGSLPSPEGAGAAQLAPPIAAAVMTGRTQSRILGDEKPYLVFLPPGYATGTQRYPVLYMLHGMGGDYQEWAEQGLFDDAERLMASGEVPPFIIVTPQGDQSYWINWADGGPRYSDYVVREVVPQIDATYRTLDDRSARAVGGLSMGGSGALQMAFNHPGVFGIVGGHSPTLRTEETALSYMGTGAFFASQDPVTLARVSDGARYLKIWLDVGRTDDWRSRVEELHQALVDRSIDHAFQELSGDHEQEYWAAWSQLYLKFYGRAFSGQ